MTKHMDEVSDSRGARYMEKTFYEIAEAMGCDKVRVAIAQFRQMMHDMGLGYPISTNFEKDLVILIESVNPVRLKNNPVSIDSTIARDIYSKIIVA